MKYRKLHIAVTVLSLTVVCVAVYWLYLVGGVIAAVYLAIFAGLPLSLLIPVTAIRYGVFGAYIGTMAGYIPHFGLSFAFWGTIPTEFESLLLVACYGGGAISGLAIGVALAASRKALSGSGV